MMRNKFNTLAQGLFGLAAMGLVACGGSSSANETTTETTISGTLGVSSLSAMDLDETPITPAAITDYSVRCVTLTGTPEAGEGKADSTGAFSLSLLVENSAPIGCFVMEGTNVVAAVIFEEAATTLDGGSTKRSGNFVADDGATGLSFGTITVDLTTGTATVDKKSITQTGGSGTSSASWENPTGAWKYEMICDTKFYATTEEYDQCVAHKAQDGGGKGDVYVKQYTATDATGAPHYGIALWSSEAALTACGGEGVTLPSGWTAASGSEKLTTAISVSALPGPADITSPQHLPCGASQGLASCNAISSTSWGGSTTVGGCKAACVAQNIWQWRDSKKNDSSGCHLDIENNWNPDVYNAVIADNSAGVHGTGKDSYIGTANGASKLVVYGDRIMSRFAMGEAEIKGRTATLMNYNERTDYVCIQNSGSHGCSAQAQCRIIMKETIAITQEDASNMRVKIDMEERLASGASATCLAAGSHIKNWLGEDGIDQQVQYIKITK